MTLIELKSLNKTKTSDSSAGAGENAAISSGSKPSSYLLAVACTCALTAFHFGYAITSINVPSSVFIGCTVEDSSKTFFGLQGCFLVSKAAWGLVGLGLPLGGWVGGSLGPSLVSWLGGLKPAILFLNFPLLFAYLSMAFAVNLPMLVLGRILIGFASGASGMLVPLYLSSISPLSFRGLFTNFFQLFLCSASFIAEIVSFSLNIGTRLWLWRFSFGAGVLVIALQTALNKFFGIFPESPIDLDSKDPIEAGMLRYRLGILDDSSQKQQESCDLREVSESCDDIPAVPELPNPVSESLLDLITFRIPSARKSLLLGICLHAGQQISGVTAIFFYSSQIIVDSRATPVLLTLINLIMTVVAIWLLDRAGRRPVALFSVAGSSVCLIVLSMSFSLFPEISSLFLVSFVACFAVGLGPIPWMLVPEIFPSTWPLTPTAISICTSANWITNIIVSGGFPSLSVLVPKPWIFLAFGVSCSVLFICLSQFLPETKNRIANFI